MSLDLLKMVLNKGRDLYLSGNLTDALAAADFVRRAALDCRSAPAQCNTLAEQVRLERRSCISATQGRHNMAVSPTAQAHTTR